VELATRSGSKLSSIM